MSANKTLHYYGLEKQVPNEPVQLRLIFNAHNGSSKHQLAYQHIYSGQGELKSVSDDQYGESLEQGGKAIPFNEEGEAPGLVSARKHHPVGGGSGPKRYSN